MGAGTRKVVINACFGGFSLSPAAVRRLAEMEGRPCYFFRRNVVGGKIGRFLPITEAEATDSMFWQAFDIPNPDSISDDSRWHTMTMEERVAHNARYSAHALDSLEIARDDPRLIQIIEELGSGHRTGASGFCAHLRIIEIPDDVEWEIEEYDGNEHVAQKHETWR